MKSRISKAQRVQREIKRQKKQERKIKREMYDFMHPDRRAAKRQNKRFSRSISNVNTALRMDFNALSQKQRNKVEQTLVNRLNDAIDAYDKVGGIPREIARQLPEGSNKFQIASKMTNSKRSQENNVTIMKGIFNEYEVLQSNNSKFMDLFLDQYLGGNYDRTNDPGKRYDYSSRFMHSDTKADIAKHFKNNPEDLFAIYDLFSNEREKNKQFEDFYMVGDFDAAVLAMSKGVTLKDKEFKDFIATARNMRVMQIEEDRRKTSEEIRRGNVIDPNNIFLNM